MSHRPFSIVASSYFERLVSRDRTSEIERSDGSNGKALRPGPMVADKTRRFARGVAEKPQPSAILLIDILRQASPQKRTPSSLRTWGRGKFVAS